VPWSAGVPLLLDDGAAVFAAVRVLVAIIVVDVRDSISAVVGVGVGVGGYVRPTAAQTTATGADTVFTGTARHGHLLNGFRG